MTSNKNNYFTSDLNYSLGNEDSKFEYSMSEAGSVIGAVAASGSRIIPLLAKNPKQIVFFDISHSQILLCKFRLSALMQLSYEDYMKLFGLSEFNESSSMPLVSEESIDVFSNLEIDNEVRSYLKNFYVKDNVVIAYQGRWEKTFHKISKMFSVIVGKNNLNKIKNANSIADQKLFLNRIFFRFRFKLAVLLLGNANLFKAILYRNDFPKKNDRRSYFEIYNTMLTNLLNRYRIRDCYFLNIIFLGKVSYYSALPFEYDRGMFELAKKNLQETKVEFLEGNLLEKIPDLGQKFDYLFLSDVPSYFTGEIERNYIQILKNSLNPDGLIVSRYYLRSSDALLDGMKDVSKLYLAQIENEASQVYNIKVYKRIV